MRGAYLAATITSILFLGGLAPAIECEQEENQEGMEFRQEILGL
jgi:hypothetical protein